MGEADVHIRAYLFFDSQQAEKLKSCSLLPQWKFMIPLQIFIWKATIRTSIILFKGLLS